LVKEKRLYLSKEMLSLDRSLKDKGSKLKRDVDDLKKGLDKYYLALLNSSEKYKNDDLILNDTMNNLSIIEDYNDRVSEIYLIPESGGEEYKTNLTDAEFKDYIKEVEMLIDKGISESKKSINNKPNEYVIESSIIKNYNEKGKLKLLKNRKLPNDIKDLSVIDEEFFEPLKDDFIDVYYEFERVRQNVDSQINITHSNNFKNNWKRDFDRIFVKLYKRLNEILDIMDKELIKENKRIILKSIQNMK